jgi:DNA/RNA endonuclease YhcR with UshA esterase domain
MKKMKNITLLSIILLTLIFAGCTEYDEPAEFVPAQMQANMTVKQLKALFTSSPLMVENEDAVVAGKVISTDKYGNLYRTLYIQDETSGIEIKIGKTTLYNTYKVGQIIYIKPHHLCLGQYGGMVSLGSPSTDSKYQNSWIDVPLLINSTIFRGEESTPVTPKIIQTTSDINDDTFGTLVTLKNASYKSGNLLTWAQKNETETTEDESSYGEQTFTLSDGREIVVRTSGYAKFADTPISCYTASGATEPIVTGKKVNITGILTKYNGTYQLVLNTDKDVLSAQ